MPQRINVKALRDAYGLNQAEFAALVPVTERTIRRWERGEVDTSPLAIARLKALQQDAPDPAPAEVDSLSSSALGPRRRALPSST